MLCRNAFAFKSALASHKSFVPIDSKIDFI